MEDELTLFHLHRSDGRSMILYPSANAEAFNKQLQNSPIKGYFGREPEVQVMTYVRRVLYMKIDEGLKSWVSDRRFIPSFLMASGMFLVAYLFMSLVIRDPIPIVDELVISVAAAIATYIYTTRKSKASAKALEMKTKLLENCDAIEFSSLPYLQKVEYWLAQVEHMNLRSLISTILFPKGELAEGEDPKMTRRLVRGLELWIGPKQMDKIERNLNTQKALEKLPAKVADILPVYALYINLKNSKPTELLE